MKKLSMLILAIAMVAVLAVAANASIVMYQNGGANMNVAKGAAGALNVSVALDEPINVYDYDYMYVRFYIDNPDNYINNGQIEITSSGTCDNAEANWDLNSMELNQGWNEWVIDLYTAGSSGGTCDYEAVNYFRVYAFTDGDNLIAVDYIAFGTEEDDFSSLATELGEEVVYEEYIPENVISRTAEGESGAVVVSAAMPASPVNMSDYDYMYVRLYVEGIDNFGGEGQIEISSKATCDIQEVNWTPSTYIAEDGWNEIVVDLYAPNGMDAAFDWENCNWFRIYQFTNGYLKFDLDYVGFGMDDTFPASYEEIPAILVPAAALDVVEEAPVAEDTSAEEAPVAEEAPAEEAPAEEAAPAYGIIEATEGFANEGAENLLDNDETTKWCMNVPAPVYAIWNVEAPVYVTGYEIVTANDNSSNPGRNPGSWILSGSTDGENWTAIATVENDTVLQDVDFTTYTFDADAAGEYSYFKFEATSIVGGGVMQISGINLLTGAAPAADDVAETPEEVVEPVETVEEVVEAPAAEDTSAIEAPQTFDFAIFAAIAAVVSLAGYAISKKR